MIVLFVIPNKISGMGLIRHVACHSTVVLKKWACSAYGPVLPEKGQRHARRPGYSNEFI